MKKCLHIFPVLLIWLLFSCVDKQEEPISYGYFQLDGIRLTCQGEVVSFTRAVDAGLQVQICQDGAVIPGQDYAPGSDFSQRIVLPAGRYTVKAFTPDQTEAADDEQGHPVYSCVSDEFVITDGDLTTLFLEVPQINTGVKVSFSSLFKEMFPAVSVTVSSESGHKATIPGTEDMNYRYFSTPASGKLSYEVSATNTDGEIFSFIKELKEVTSKNYQIEITVE